MQPRSTEPTLCSDKDNIHNPKEQLRSSDLNVPEKLSIPILSNQLENVLWRFFRVVDMHNTPRFLDLTLCHCFIPRWAGQKPLPYLKYGSLLINCFSKLQEQKGAKQPWSMLQPLEWVQRCSSFADWLVFRRLPSPRVIQSYKSANPMGPPRL